jgi:hypothetical protein
VTQLFDIMIMATPEIEIYTSRTLPNWELYASRHGYSLHVYDTKPLSEMHVNWSKIEHARRHLQASRADWMVVADADTWVNMPDRSLDEFVDVAERNGQDMVFSSDVSNWFGMLFPLNSLGVRECRRWICPNAGFFAVRNNAAGNRFLDNWMKLALGTCADIADTPPRDQWVLWRGLFGPEPALFGLDTSCVLRVISEFHWQHLIRTGRQPFIVHDKRLTEMYRRSTL